MIVVFGFATDDLCEKKTPKRILELCDYEHGEYFRRPFCLANFHRSGRGRMQISAADQEALFSDSLLLK